MVLFDQNALMSPTAIRVPQNPSGAATGRRKTAEIPAFALYGEMPAGGADLLHIEDVQSRSSLYQWEISPHVHQGLYQVLWVQHGAVQITLDARQSALEGPLVVVVPPGVVHGFRFAPGTDGLVLTLSARLMVEADFQSVGEAFRAVFETPAVRALPPEDPLAERLHALLRNLADEFALPGGADSPVVLWLARAIVWRLAQVRSQVLSPAGEPTASRALRQQAAFTRFLLLVENHYAEHWPLDRYASRLGLSTQRLNRIAREQSARSALECVHERLTREACRRLIYIAAPVANLASELGFEDAAYFSRFFRRRMGMTPQQYRVGQGLVA